MILETQKKSRECQEITKKVNLKDNYQTEKDTDSYNKEA